MAVPSRGSHRRGKRPIGAPSNDGLVRQEQEAPERGGAVEVFDEMRKLGHLPDSETIAITMNAYGKLKEFDTAAVLYRALKEDGCVFSDRVHFQILSLLGAQQDFEALEQLVG